MKSLSISQKLVIYLIIISILPYAFISYFNYSAEKNTFDTNLFTDLSALAEAKSTHIITVVNFRIEQLREVATSGFMQEIDNGNITNLNLNLKRVKNEIPEFFEILALDRNGTVVASTNSGLINKSYADDDIFKIGKEELYIGSINSYDESSGYTISYRVLNRSTNKFIGVAAVRIYPLFIYNITSDYTGLGKSGETLLVQKRGNEVIFLNPLRHNPDAALKLRYPLDSNLAIPAILASTGKNGTIRTLDYRGVDVYSAYTYIPIIDLGMVVKIDSSEALMPLDTSKKRFIGLGIFYFAVIAIFAYILGRRFTSPLIRLSDASKKVAKGYLLVHIEPESKDEIGELAGSFNIMVERLREVYEGLEQKVKARTEDLNRRNLELSALIKTNQSISAGLDLNKILEIAGREAARIVNVSYCSIVLVENGMDHGTIAEEYNAKNHLKPSLGEILYFKDFPSLNDALEKKDYVLIEDTGKVELSKKEKELVEKFNIKSILVVPLILGEKTLGTMQVCSLDKVKDFTGDDISICRTIANQAAIAIENAHLFSQLMKHDRTLNTLFEIDRVLSQSLDLDEMLKIAIVKTIQLTSSDAGWIYLLKEDGVTLKLETYQGISPELAEKASKLKVGEGVSGLAVKSGKPVIMDIEKFPFKELKPLMIKDGISSLAGSPLIAKGKMVGAIILSNREHRIFSKEDIDLLASIGSQIGVAVENSRLYSELKRHDKTLETLFEIDRVVSQSLDIDKIFKEALAKTVQVTSSDVGAIYLLEEEGEKLKLKTSVGISDTFARAVSEIPVGVGISGTVAIAKKPVVTDIDHYPSRELLPLLEKEGIITLVGIPLMTKGTVVGAMSLGNRRRRIYTKEDLDVLESIGGQIGVGVENARLYHESRVSYEKLQAAYDELKSLDRMKTDFLSNVSHELKTPLISIHGYSELMYDEKIGSLTQTQKKSLEAIIRNTNRLTRLIDGLLYLSIQQIGKPEIKMKPKPQNIDEIISVSMADMNVMAEEKNLSMMKDSPTDLVVMGDRDRLTEVFMNLLGNAIKFTEPGGRISIKAWKEEDNAHITVADNGIGIPENVIPYLFQRFYQADASITRKYGGTGLGLYICKSIIDDHKGKIWIESKMGKGTTVHLLLPVAKKSGDDE